MSELLDENMIKYHHSRSKKVFYRKKRNPKYTVDESIFEKIDTEEKAYWLGLLMADGTIIKNNKKIPCGISLGLIDGELIEKFKSFLKTDSTIKKYIKKYKGKQISTLFICSHKIVKDVSKFGLVENKTNRTFIPDISLNLIRHFIRGYFDGDGCLYNNEVLRLRSITIASCSVKILNQIEGYFKKIGCIRNNRLFIRHQVGNCWIFRTGQNEEVLNFLNHIYENANIFMDRKYQKYLDIKNKPLNNNKNKRHSKYIGVSFHKLNKDKPYGATIYLNNIRYFLGYFAHEEEAALVYNQKAIELELPNYKLNKIEPDPIISP